MTTAGRKYKEQQMSDEVPKYAIRKRGLCVHRLLLRDLDLAAVDLVNDVVRGLAVDRAANALCRAEDLLRAVREPLRKGF